MDLSFSTSWNSRIVGSAAEMIDQVRSLGFDSVELNFSLPRSWVEDVEALNRSGVIKVSSLHNMCPIPDEIEPKNASPDSYSLSALDDDERLKAVRAAENTIDWALRLRAKAVVIHAGRVPIKDRTRELAGLIDLDADEKIVEKIRADMMRERAEIAPKHFDKLKFSLEALVRYAESKGVVIGVENRYYYREMPVAEEFAAIFELFPSENIGYWHDVGHAEVFARTGLVSSHEELIGRFQNRLVGLHIHDIIGVCGDHQAPGSGTFEFSRIAPFLNSELIRVLEVHQPVSPDEIRRSVQYLSRIQ